jgi:hypothetical protein
MSISSGDLLSRKESTNRKDNYGSVGAVRDTAAIVTG